jgi:hypothetical protein
LAIYRDGPGRLCDILTGDETWFYLRQIKNKSLNRTWINELEEPKTVLRRGIYEPKFMFCLFFRTSGPVLVHMVKNRMTIYN